tara:strand:+ start:127 stop:705 length:579 start_codon:yes stop_codon:yes gene_type:complete
MKNIVSIIIACMLIGCGEAEATDESNIVNKTLTKRSVVKPPVTDYTDYTTVKPVEIDLDDMTFTEAFGVQYKAKGEGHTFWWRGEEYTTDLAVVDEFVLDHLIFGINVVNTDRMGWVTNNDDPDDNCKSNILDDCGICDGPGKITWFRDKDNDGLGAVTEWITSCTFPKTTEIERFHEDLREGGGDQGTIGE